MATIALCSLDVRDHVGRNPYHGVCTKLQQCTRIIGRSFCPKNCIYIYMNRICGYLKIRDNRNIISKFLVFIETSWIWRAPN